MLGLRIGDSIVARMTWLRRCNDAAEERNQLHGSQHESLSCTQGMLRSAVLGQFYLDLQDPLYKTPFAIYHRRYSTNTTPKWPLAQPMRCLGHNGARRCLC